MNTLNTGRVGQLLKRLHQEAEVADGPLLREMMMRLGASNSTIEQTAAQMIADERADYRSVYRSHAEHFLSISPDYGRFLYAVARASKATRIVEFGTSMGISTLYLAAAIRDNGGGQPVLKLIEPHLRPGAVILAENAFAADYLSYVREPANGYVAQALPIDEGRGNEFAVRVL